MGSFMFTHSRTCVRYLQPLFGLQAYRQPAPVVLQSGKNFKVRPFCTKNEKSGPERRPKLRDEDRPRSRSVFAAGTAKRTAENFKRIAGTEEEPTGRSVRDRAPSSVEEIPDGPLSVPEWRKLKGSSSRPERFEMRMMESMLSARTDVAVAKSLLAYVATDSGTVPYVLLLRYLALCVFGGHHSEVLDTYDLMRSCFKTIDTGAYTLFVKGFSRTERWREALLMLEEVKKVITPTPRIYGDAISGAFLHGDSETGWMLYGELVEMGLMPNQDTWQCLFDCAAGQQEHRDKLLDILTDMRENQVYPTKLLATSIKNWFESLPGEEWTGRFSSVDSRGRCRSCQAELESIALSEEEYAQLKLRVMEDIIEGRDVFNKTTPESPLT